MQQVGSISRLDTCPEFRKLVNLVKSNGGIFLPGLENVEYYANILQKLGNSNYSKMQVAVEGMTEAIKLINFWFMMVEVCNEILKNLNDEDKDKFCMQYEFNKEFLVDALKVAQKRFQEDLSTALDYISKGIQQNMKD